jgi:GIY-YIG catalytic domain
MEYDFCESLINVGISDILMLDEIYLGKDELTKFFAEIGHKKTRRHLFKYLGLDIKTYKEDSIKLLHIILERIGIKTVNTNARLRVDVPQLTPVRHGLRVTLRSTIFNFVVDDNLVGIRALIVSGNKVGIYHWFNDKNNSYVKENMRCGVYRIIHIPTKNNYIGSTYNFTIREKQHFYHLKNKSHTNKSLQKLWNESDEEDFLFEILELTTDYAKQENVWIKNADKNFLLNYSSTGGLKRTYISRENFDKLHSLSEDLEKDIQALANEIFDLYFDDLDERPR